VDVLRVSEIVSVAYFGALAAAAWLRPAGPATRAILTLLASGVVAAPVLLAAFEPAWMAGIARDWLPLALLPIAYWTPSALIRRAAPDFERWLLRGDRWFFATFAGYALRHAPRPLQELLEASYVLVYPMVPAGLGWLAAEGLRAEADRFWTVVLVSEYACYALLPVLPSRPPRMSEPTLGQPLVSSAVRRLNLFVLGLASNHWNTFPSGHVAGAWATALAVASVLPAAGAVLGVLAAGITLGSVSGRYHYVADAAGGVLVALLVYALVL
jgi:membrane-associated phospholipid phosphatase